MSESVRCLLEDVQKGVRLASHLFTLSEHCSRQGESPIDLWDFQTMQPINGWRYVGWCPAASTVLPESSWGSGYELAVLVENAVGVRIWFHAKATPDLVMAAFRAYR